MSKVSKAQLIAETALDDTGERMIPEHHKGRNIYGCHIARYEVAVDFVKGKQVLDIACGSGYGTSLLAKEAKRVIGVDVSEESVLYAREHYAGKNIEFICGDGVSIPLADGTVDVVVSYETIEHIEDYEGFMREIKRVLKPGGTLLLSTPNDDEYVEGNPYHIHEFTYKELVSLVSKYYKYHEDYFQNQWYSNTIVPASLQSQEWDKTMRTINTCSSSPEQGLYFFIVCSDEKINRKLSDISVIGEPQNLIAAQAHNVKDKERLQLIHELSEQATRDHKLLKEYEQRIARLENSLSLRVTKPLRGIARVVREGSAVARRNKRNNG